MLLARLLESRVRLEKADRDRAPVLLNPPLLAVLRTVTIFRFLFRFRQFTSYSSGSDFWQVTVPVPAPYLGHKKQFTKIFGKLFTRKKLISFIKLIVKCEWKKCQIHNFTLCLWELLWFHPIKVPVPLRKKVTDPSYDSGSDSTLIIRSNVLSRRRKKFCKAFSKCCGSRSGSFQLSFWASRINIRKQEFLDPKTEQDQNYPYLKKKKTVHFTPSYKSCQLASLKMLP